jgi:hypothetical protein
VIWFSPSLWNVKVDWQIFVRFLSIQTKKTAGEFKDVCLKTDHPSQNMIHQGQLCYFSLAQQLRKSSGHCDRSSLIISVVVCLCAGDVGIAGL